MGISVPRLYEPNQAVHEELIPELHISEVNWEVERTYEIQEVDAESIIVISLAKLLSRPSISIHWEHVGASPQSLYLSAWLPDIMKKTYHKRSLGLG
jgi:hypothetical protein